jgi:hypothetical protein
LNRVRGRSRAHFGQCFVGPVASSGSARAGGNEGNATGGGFSTSRTHTLTDDFATPRCAAIQRTL